MILSGDVSGYRLLRWDAFENLSRLQFFQTLKKEGTPISPQDKKVFFRFFLAVCNDMPDGGPVPYLK